MVNRITTKGNFFALGFGFVLAATAVQQTAARPLSEILQSGVLRACVPTASPPDAVVTPEGCTGYCEYGGVLGDLVEAFADSNDLETEYFVKSWDGLFHNADGVTDKEGSYTPISLANNECDMIGAVMVSLDWRLKKIDMECFLPSRMMVVTRKDNLAELKSVEDLAGKTVSVEQSMSLHTWVEDQNAGPLQDNPIRIAFNDYKDSIPVVDAGGADFTVVSVLDALYQTRNISKDSVAAFAVGPTDYGCWGYNKDDTEMGALMKAFFDVQTSQADSQLNQVWDNYYGMSFFDFVRLVSAIQ